MDELSLLKIERANWSILLDTQNFYAAFQAYNIYIEKLRNINGFSDKVNNEIQLSKKFFQLKLNIFADKFLNEKNYAQAVELYNYAFKIDNKDINSIKNYITCLEKLNHHDLTLMLLKYLESISANNPDALKYVYSKYFTLEHYTNALETMKKYIAIKGEENLTAAEYDDLGIFYEKYSNITHKRIDRENSYHAFAKASDLAPEVHDYANNATVIAHTLGDIELARKYWDRILKINKMNNESKYYYSMFCLRTGNFENWHKYYDGRLKKEHDRPYYPELKNTMWNGTQDLSNSTLLIYCEQGYGDTFWIWGYMPRICKLAKNVIFIVQDSIYDLLKDNEYGVKVYSKDTVNSDDLIYDFYIFSMSVPTVLKLDRNNISVGEGYIKPDTELINSIKNKYFSDNKFKIGISFKGHTSGNASRNIDIKEFLLLDELENIEIYNFTKGISDKEFEIFKKNKVKNIVNDFKNFNETAAALINCDLILTSDNCILNLAGAIGVKTFALFNWAYELRWFDLSGDNVIYYTNVKPYICDDLDNWQSVMTIAVNDIKNFIQSKQESL